MENFIGNFVALALVTLLIMVIGFFIALTTRKQKVITLVLIIIGTCIYMIPKTSVKAATKDEMINVIRQAASDYREKENFQEQCTIDGVPVSLGAVMYSKAIQEGTFKGKLSWTNNWYSLHKDVGKFKPLSYTKADWTNTRPVYKTAYEGTYEAIHLLVSNPLYKKCNMDYSTVKAYISGPKAPDSKTHKARCIKGSCTIKNFVNYKLKQNLNQALLYDKIKDEVSDKPTTIQQKKDEVSDKPTTIQQKKETGFDIITDEKSCKLLGYTDMDYIQIDSLSGELVDQVVNTHGTLKMFKCKINK